MSLTVEQVKKIAKLARIKLSDDEVAKYQHELSTILHWVEQLGEVNTAGVEPMYSTVDKPLPMRTDQVTDGDLQKQVLSNTTNAKYGYFTVPKVVE
jgi:aspartyl-tRNA(Asn)/glutamyl-tRNA(Gln) amidotransferase subunit C